MRSLGRWLGWLGLALCMLRLKAELITHLNPPKPELSSHPCVFPFTYGDMTHYSCISIHSDFSWCSLDSQFQGRWRYCTSSDPPQCSFPFLFKSKVFHTCTKEDYILDRSWCSLTKNYNKDKKWKQCSPYNGFSSLGVHLSSDSKRNPPRAF